MTSAPDEVPNLLTLPAASFPARLWASAAAETLLEAVNNCLKPTSLGNCPDAP